VNTHTKLLCGFVVKFKNCFLSWENYYHNTSFKNNVSLLISFAMFFLGSIFNCLLKVLSLDNDTFVSLQNFFFVLPKSFAQQQDGRQTNSRFVDVCDCSCVASDASSARK